CASSDARNPARCPAVPRRPRRPPNKTTYQHHSFDVEDLEGEGRRLAANPLQIAQNRQRRRTTEETSRTPIERFEPAAEPACSNLLEPQARLWQRATLPPEHDHVLVHAIAELAQKQHRSHLQHLAFCSLETTHPNFAKIRGECVSRRMLLPPMRVTQAVRI